MRFARFAAVLVPAAILLTRPAVCLSSDAASYVRRGIPAIRCAAPPLIDGDLSDPLWQSAAKAETFIDRQTGSPVGDQTTAYLAYDDGFIYVAFHARDSQPERITARETIRDSKYTNGGGMGGSDDFVEVSFDPFLSRKWDDLASFSLNAIGTRSARLGGGRAGKAEWKGDWEGAVKRVPDGWCAEMRIPWGILNYPQARGPVAMGVNFTRFQERTKLESVWSNIGSQYFLDQAGTWTGVEVPKAAFRRTLSVLPYVMPSAFRLAGGERTGLDARYTVTPELTAVGSINPDFATIEGAVEGIQFSRSERFVPERRPFFLEGNQYFQAGSDYSLGPLWYPNRISNFDTGMKVYGKVTPADTIGVLGTADFGNQSNVVARFRHDISPTASSSLFFTQKSAIDDNNTMGMLLNDARWGKLGLESQLGVSTGQAAGGAAKAVNLNWQDKSYFTSIQYLDVSPLFRDANGLIFFTDHRGFHSFTDWGTQWRHGPWRGFDVSFYPEYDWHTDGRPFRRGGGIDLSWETRADDMVGFGANREKFDDTTDETYRLYFRRGVTNRFRQWGINLGTGRQASSPYTFVGPSFSVRVLKRMDVAYGGAFQSFQGHQQQHVLTLNYEVSPVRSIGGRVVVQDGATNWYLSFRHSGERGTEMFVMIGDPNAPRFAERVAFKLVFAM